MTSAQTGALFQCRASQLAAYVVRAGLKPQDACDVVQETFTLLMDRDGQADIRDVDAWLFGTARNLASEIRQRPRTLELWADDVAAEPDRSAETEERRRLVREAVRALPEQLRTPLLLAHWRGWTCKRIGKLLGITENAVSLRLSRAKRTVAAYLRPRLA